MVLSWIPWWSILSTISGEVFYSVLKVACYNVPYVMMLYWAPFFVHPQKVIIYHTQEMLIPWKLRTDWSIFDNANARILTHYTAIFMIFVRIGCQCSIDEKFSEHKKWASHLVWFKQYCTSIIALCVANDEST